MSPSRKSAKPAEPRPLNYYVRRSLKRYFKDLNGSDPVNDLYDMVLGEVEPALLETVMQHSEGNQSEAAEILGINRGTLRKKLKHYDIQP